MITYAEALAEVEELEAASSADPPPGDLCAQICDAIQRICPHYEDLCDRLRALDEANGCECDYPE